MKTPNAFLCRLYGLSGQRLARKLVKKLVAVCEGEFAWSPTIRAIYRRYHGIEAGYGTYGGAFAEDKIAPGTVFGDYCSIADGVHVLNANHPMRYFSMHPMFYRPALGYVREETIRRTGLAIGHDVWIGVNAMILPSVTSIGNGAVVGAGAIVTKDVPSYTVVAGTPAKAIRKRFDDATIAKLEDSRWWELGKDTLFERRKEFEGIVNCSLENLG